MYVYLMTSYPLNNSLGRDAVTASMDDNNDDDDDDEVIEWNNTAGGQPTPTDKMKI